MWPQMEQTISSPVPLMRIVTGQQALIGRLLIRATLKQPRNSLQRYLALTEYGIYFASTAISMNQH